MVLLPVRILFCYAWTVGQREGERERERERVRERERERRERERERNVRCEENVKLASRFQETCIDQYNFLNI